MKQKLVSIYASSKKRQKLLLSQIKQVASLAIHGYQEDNKGLLCKLYAHNFHNSHEKTNALKQSAKTHTRRKTTWIGLSLLKKLSQ